MRIKNGRPLNLLARKKLLPMEISEILLKESCILVIIYKQLKRSCYLCSTGTLKQTLSNVFILETSYRGPTIL